MTERRRIDINEDPVCGMSVDRNLAHGKGLVQPVEGREYVFCGKGCLLEFRDDPVRYLEATDKPSMM